MKQFKLAQGSAELNPDMFVAFLSCPFQRMLRGNSAQLIHTFVAKVLEQ